MFLVAIPHFSKLPFPFMVHESPPLAVLLAISNQIMLDYKISDKYSVASTFKGAPMTPQERLEELQSAYRKADNIFDALEKLGAITIEGPLASMMYDSLALASKATSEVIGLEYGALEWFIWENEWGKKKLAAKKEGKHAVVIDSIEAFLEFELPS